MLEQKVTGTEAFRAYAALLRRTASRRPAPAASCCPRRPRRWPALPYHAFHPLASSAAGPRSSAARRRAPPGSTRRLGRGGRARLRSLPGIGPWTAAEVVRSAFGDPDAVSVGDYHVPNTVAWALAGEPRGTDERMLELLEPYRGQRGRVQRLLEVGRITAPRCGPRMAPRSIAAL